MFSNFISLFVLCSYVCLMRGKLNVFETVCIYFSLLDRMYWYFIWFAQFIFIGSTRLLVYGLLIVREHLL